MSPSLPMLFILKKNYCADGNDGFNIYESSLMLFECNVHVRHTSPSKTCKDDAPNCSGDSSVTGRLFLRAEGSLMSNSRRVSGL